MSEEATKPKHAGGRPSLYSNAYPNEVKEHLAQGYTLASWAGDVGVCRDTVYEWASKHQEFSYAVKVGRAKGQLVWEKRLADQALTGAGNSTAIIFAMKNLYQDDWSDKVINEHTGKNGGAIQTEDVTDPKDIARRMAFVLASAAKPDA